MNRNTAAGLALAVVAAFGILFFALGILNRIGIPATILHSLPAIFITLQALLIGYLFRTMRLPVFYVAGHAPSATVAGCAAAGSVCAAGLVLVLTGFGTPGWVAPETVGLGLVAGIAINGVLIAPYVRKYGSNTLPTFLGARYNRIIEAAAAAILLVFSVGMLFVHYDLLTGLLGHFTDFAPSQSALLILAVAAFITVLSGLQGISWLSAVTAFLVLTGLLGTTAALSEILTGSAFPYFREGAAAAALSEFTETATPAGSAAGTSLLLILGLMCGTAVSPQIVSGISTVRRPELSLNAVLWAAGATSVIFALFPVWQLYFELAVGSLVDGNTGGPFPLWALNLARDGLATVCGSETVSRAALDAACAEEGGLSLAGLSFEPEVILPVIPGLAGLPGYFSGVIVAVLLAALLAGLCFFLHLTAALLSENLYLRYLDRRAPRGRQLVVARLLIILSAVILFLTPEIPDFPAAPALVSGLGLISSTVLPLLILGIWWKPSNGAGALAGVTIGAAFAIGVIILTAPAPLGFGDPPLFGMDYSNFGFPGFLLSSVTHIGLSLLVSGRSEARDALVDKIRQAGGDTISLSAIDRWEG